MPQRRRNPHAGRTRRRKDRYPMFTAHCRSATAWPGLAPSGTKVATAAPPTPDHVREGDSMQWHLVSGSILLPGQYLKVGDYIQSPGRTCFAVMQSDGNFAVYAG